MMSWVWFGLIAISVVFGILTGKINQVSQAAISGASEAVTLFLILLATICLWSGIMKIADKAGITLLLQKLLLPITKRLFPDVKPESAGMKAISMNIAANLLGLGNAATPLGLQAMKELSAHSVEHGSVEHGSVEHGSKDKSTATNSMITFVVMNTASLQLIPTTIAAMRIKYGSASPFDIVPAVWLASIVTLIFGITLSKVLEQGKKKR
jgi:spore maturation protein A